MRSSILRSTPGIGDCTQSDAPAWTEARLMKSALTRMIGCTRLYQSPEISQRKNVTNSNKPVAKARGLAAN
jgi:hypothetical protein